ncbi:hypothetical protein KE480_07625 [Enterococcus sp. 079]|nr:hypothetical protein [Enterococcus sp. 079]
MRIAALLFYIETGKDLFRKTQVPSQLKTFLSLQPPPPFEKKGSERCTFTKIWCLAKQDKIDKTSSHQRFVPVRYLFIDLPDRQQVAFYHQKATRTRVNGTLRALVLVAFR